MSRFIKSVSEPFTKVLESGKKVQMVTITRGETEDSVFQEIENVDAGGEFDPSPGNLNYNAVADKE